MLMCRVSVTADGDVGLMFKVSVTADGDVGLMCRVSVTADGDVQGICHYLLMPVVYLMGVRWEDAGQVAELIALKTFLNEFVAYEKLSEFIQNRVTCSTEGHILSVSTLPFFHR